MNLKQKIDQDLKSALLGGDKERATVLRSIKSVVLYEEVAAGTNRSRDQGLGDEQILRILQKEAKKRQESADLYVKGGSQDRADAELAEKAIIEEYLPRQLSEDEIKALIEVVETEHGMVTKETMGAVISAVKDRAHGAADGAVIAKLVRERLAG